MMTPDTAAATSTVVPWEVAASIVVPIVGAGVLVVKWMMGRLDANAATLQEAIDALKDAVDAATIVRSEETTARNAMVRQQEQIAYTQERILGLLQREFKLIDQEREAHGEGAVGSGIGVRRS